jgi:hypothetical protein
MAIDIDGLSFAELLELNQRVVARLKMLEAMQAHVDMMVFNIGARVCFDGPNGRIGGNLAKYNRKTVTILTDDGQRWNVSPHLLRAVKDVPSNHDRTPTATARLPHAKSRKRRKR